MALLTSSQIVDMKVAFDELNKFIRMYAEGTINEARMDSNIRGFTCERIIYGLLNVAQTIVGANALFNQYVRMGEFMSNPISKKLAEDTLEYLKTDPLVPGADCTDVSTIFSAYCYLTCIFTEGIVAYKQRCTENVIFTIDLQNQVIAMKKK
jgi:hypothetical protein